MKFGRSFETAVVLVLAFASLGFGKIARPMPYNPVLMGPPPGPCNPLRNEADVVAGADVYGNPVRPADLPRAGDGDLNGATVLAEVPGHSSNLRSVDVPVDVGRLMDSTASHCHAEPQPHS